MSFCTLAIRVLHVLGYGNEEALRELQLGRGRGHRCAEVGGGVANFCPPEMHEYNIILTHGQRHICPISSFLEKKKSKMADKMVTVLDVTPLSTP